MGWTLASTPSEEGTLWRAEIDDDLGRLLDATRWTRHPRRAIADGEALAAGTYWVSDNRAPFTRAA